MSPTSTASHRARRGEPLRPGATVGVLGGGQLGRMMAIEARRMGYRIVVLDPDARCPTGQFADEVVIGALTDVDAALELAGQVDVVTLDTEHVPADVLDRIDEVVPVRPRGAIFRTIQDRQSQKQFLDRLGLPQTPWAPVDEAAGPASALAAVGLPAFLKVRTAGYDGKGQVRIEHADAAAAAWERVGHRPSVVERVVPFVREVSVILARGVGGDVAIYPLAENVHRHHILHTTRAPAPMPEARRAHAETIARTIAEALDHVGVMAVELFELPDGQLLVNEIAPRTHNSGHYTLGACATSQFEQHVRAVCGLPLGDPRALTGAVMLNLIGDLWRDGPPRWDPVLAHAEARLHLYGKLAPAPGRKMGHVVLLDDDTDRALRHAEAMLAALTPA
jgi:5-(carboxyamino)imidazole ribonucleotide synthase